MSTVREQMGTGVGAVRPGWPLPLTLGRRAVRFIGPILTLALIWEALARLQLVSSVLFPPPSRVVATVIQMAGPQGGYILWSHMALSLYRLGVGFLLAAAVAVPFGTLVGMSPRAHAFFSPILSILIPIPSLAWVPIAILWLGIGNATPIFIVFFTAIFPIIYNAAMGVRSVDQKHLWAARIMGANTRQLFFGVILPAGLGHLITGLKLGLSSGWRALVAAEMLAATAYGLGLMIFEARTFLQVEVMYGGIFVLAILGFLLENLLFGTLEVRTLQRWGLVRGME